MQRPDPAARSGAGDSASRDASGSPRPEPGDPPREPEPAGSRFTVQNRQRRFPVDPRALAAFLERVAADVAPGDRRGATLRIVSDRNIRELNRRYRDRDRATDVLAFPADPVPAGLLSEEESAYLGDLVVSAETAARQARDAGVELADEIRVLAVHGYLHLLGYDHERDRGEMVRLERVLKLRHGLSRPGALGAHAAFSTG